MVITGGSEGAIGACVGERVRVQQKEITEIRNAPFCWFKSQSLRVPPAIRGELIEALVLSETYLRIQQLPTLLLHQKQHTPRDSYVLPGSARNASSEDVCMRKKQSTMIGSGLPSAHILTNLSSPPVTSTLPDLVPRFKQFTREPGCAT